MSIFEADTYFPRAGDRATRSLAQLFGRPVDEITELEIDLRDAEFHPAGERKISREQLVDWRGELNRWAHDRAFPSKQNTAERVDWDVEIGQRLLDDFDGLPEAHHPKVWCWLATFLLPHLVVYRWGWPNVVEGAPPQKTGSWRRFNTSATNGLRLAMTRIATYGPDVTRRASEQEFQSILNRPAFGIDRRVARVILETLVDAADDADSLYGKSGGTRALDANDVCIELRLINSLRPLCFADDDHIVAIVHDVIERLPKLRRSKESDLEEPAAPTR